MIESQIFGIDNGAVFLIAVYATAFITWSTVKRFTK